MSSCRIMTLALVTWSASTPWLANQDALPAQATTKDSAAPSRKGPVVSSDSVAAQTDPYCGPRCVHHVLRHYGIKRELVECVRELRWNSERSGVDLQSMAELLQEEGIHAAAFAAKPGYVVQWEHPVIAHLASADPDIGHFVVLRPDSSRDTVRAWDGPASERIMSAQTFSELVDGGVLLTSPLPIDSSIQPFRLTTDELAWRSGLIMFAALLSGASWTLRRRLRTSPPDAGADGAPNASDVTSSDA